MKQIRDKDVEFVSVLASPPLLEAARLLLEWLSDGQVISEKRKETKPREQDKAK